MLSVTHVATGSLDTTVVLPVTPPAGGQWSHEASESRWVSGRPVAVVSRRSAPPGLAVRITGPGSIRITVRAGDRRESALVEAIPSMPVVLSLEQPQWPESDEITITGYAVDRIPASRITVDGESVTALGGDSAQVVVLAPPLNGGACSGSPIGSGNLAIPAGIAHTEISTGIQRLAGPLAVLEVGEHYRTDGNDACFRIVSDPGAGFTLAGLDRAVIDAAKERPERVEYGGGDDYRYLISDVSLAGARAGPSRVVAAPELAAPRPPPVHVRAAASNVGNPASIYERESPLAVGDRFEWVTQERLSRTGSYVVVGLYPPNIVLAVFEEDGGWLWNDSRSQAFHETLTRLGEAPAQGVYEAAFGGSPPLTSEATGQMLVMFHDGSGGDATGVTVHAPEDIGTTAVFVRRFDSDDDGRWYGKLLAHELAHAWHLGNVGRLSAIWSIEGIADWVVDEERRLAAGLRLDANLDPTDRVLGDPVAWRLPSSGDFLYGYRESDGFLRSLVARLMGERGESFEAASRRVIHGVAEGWYGHHFRSWSNRSQPWTAPGLVGRMREVLPNWDPVEARLHWLVSIALDDRARGADLPAIPFVRDSWSLYGPLYDFTFGRAEEFVGKAHAGGQFYFMAHNPEGLAVSWRFKTTEPDVNLAWKLVRYR